MITKKNDKEVDSEYKKMKYSWKNLVNHLGKNLSSNFYFIENYFLGEINGVSHLVSEVKLKASNENINWEEQFLSLQNSFQNKSDHFESLNEDFQLPLLRKISDQLIEDSTQKIRSDHLLNKILSFNKLFILKNIQRIFSSNIQISISSSFCCINSVIFLLVFYRCQGF